MIANDLKSYFYRIRSLALKELQTLLGNKQSRRLLILPLVIQVVLYPVAVTLEVKRATIVIFNQDYGERATELTQRIANGGAFTKLLLVNSEQELTRAIDNRKAMVGLQIPVDFSRDLEAGTQTRIQVILDGRRSNSAQIAFGYIQNIVKTYLSEQGGAPGFFQHSELMIRSWFNPNLDYKYFILPSLIAIITTIGTMVVTALSIAREREQGTFEQLLVSPLTLEMIMIGKVIPALIIATIQATIILLAAVTVYQVPFQGSLLLLYASMLVYGVALVGFGLLISSVCQTQQQAFLGAFCFLMPAILLSGFTAPIENMPQWLQAITWLNPLRQFMEIVQGVFLKDISAARVCELAWPLVIIAIATLVMASVIFRRER